jgi:hypothetical protein
LMLSERGINSTPLSILALYINGSMKDLQSTPAPLNFTIPPPSVATLPHSKASSTRKRRGSSLSSLTPLTQSSAVAGMTKMKVGRAGQGFRIVDVQSTSKGTSDSKLHLLKALATVNACKETMWNHFRTQYQKDGLDRADFDELFSNYERCAWLLRL